MKQKNTCKVCGKYIPMFGPSSTYCSKICEDNWGVSGDDKIKNLMNMFGMKK